MNRPQAEGVTPALFKRQPWEEHPDMFPTCDWGYCDKPTVGVRYAGGMAWLSVCEEHAHSEAEQDAVKSTGGER